MSDLPDRLKTAQLILSKQLELRDGEIPMSRESTTQLRDLLDEAARSIAALELRVAAVERMITNPNGEDRATLTVNVLRFWDESAQEYLKRSLMSEAELLAVAGVKKT